MMNVVALGLVLSSLVTAGLWSPGAERRREEEPRMILRREEHRVVVVELEREGVVEPPEKSTLQPLPTDAHRKVHHLAQDAWHLPGEAVHAVEVGADKANDAVKGTVDSVADTASTVLHGAGGVARNIKEKAADAEHSIKDQVHQVAENTGEMYGSAKAKVAGTLGSVRDVGVGIRNKCREAASFIPNIGQGLANGGTEETCNGEENRPATARDAGLTDEALENLKDKVSLAAGKATDKIKDGAENAARRARETYDSVKESIGMAGDEHGEQGFGAGASKRSSLDDVVSRGKDTFALTNQRFDEYANERARRVERAVKRAGELALEKFREAMDEAYRMAPDEGEMLRAEDHFSDNGVSREHIDATVGGSSKGVVGGGCSSVVSSLKRFSSREALKSMVLLIHLCTFATVYGISVWFTFFAGHVLGGAIPRQQFGFVQSKMHAVYFKTVSCGLSISLLAHVMMQSSTKSEGWQSYNLLVSLFFTLVNMFYLEPMATKVMVEKLKLEKEEGRGRDVGDIDTRLNTTDRSEENVKRRMVEVNKKLKVLNGYSSIANMVALMSLSWHIAYLSLRVNI